MERKFFSELKSRAPEMNNNRVLSITKKTAIIFSLALSVFLVSPARGYVLPLWALLDQMQQKRENSPVESMAVEGNFTIHERDGQRTILSVNRNIMTDGRCRTDVVEAPDPDYKGAFVFWDGNRRQDSGQERLEALFLVEQITCPLAASRNDASEVIGRHIDRLGIDKGYTGLSRLDGRVSYTIGGRPWDEDLAQLWLDKERLVPVRARGRINNGSFDIHMMGYGDPVSGDWHPRLIKLYIDGKLKAEFNIDNIEINADMPASIFR